MTRPHIGTTFRTLFAAWFCLTLAASGAGIVLTRGGKEESPEYWKPVEYTTVETYPVSVRIKVKGTGQELVLLNNQVGQIIPFPDLSKASLVEQADFQELKQKRDELERDAAKFPKAAAFLSPEVATLDSILAKSRQGQVLLSGAWMSRADYDAQVKRSQSSSGSGMLAQFEIEGQMLQNVSVSAIRDGRIALIHSGGIVYVNSATLSPAQLAQLKGIAQTKFKAAEEAAAAALAAAKEKEAALAAAKEREAALAAAKEKGASMSSSSGSLARKSDEAAEARAKEAVEKAASLTAARKKFAAEVSLFLQSLTEGLSKATPAEWPLLDTAVHTRAHALQATVPDNSSSGEAQKEAELSQNALDVVVAWGLAASAWKSGEGTMAMEVLSRPELPERSDVDPIRSPLWKTVSKMKLEIKGLHDQAEVHVRKYNELLRAEKTTLATQELEKAASIFPSSKWKKTLEDLRKNSLGL